VSTPANRSPPAAPHPTPHHYGQGARTSHPTGSTPGMSTAATAAADRPSAVLAWSRSALTSAAAPAPTWATMALDVLSPASSLATSTSARSSVAASSPLRIGTEPATTFPISHDATAAAFGPKWSRSTVSLSVSSAPTTSRVVPALAKRRSRAAAAPFRPASAARGSPFRKGVRPARRLTTSSPWSSTWTRPAMVLGQYQYATRT
jgi:hypothetical protein